MSDISIHFALNEEISVLINSIMVDWNISDEEYEENPEEFLNEALGEAQSAMCMRNNYD